MSETKHETTLIGWHFSNTDETLEWGDGRAIVVGQTHAVDPPITLCRHGLHASIDLLDALGYAPGPILHKVELSGEIFIGHDKAVATHRKYLARLDCTSLLNNFAKACALSVVHLWEPPYDVMRFLSSDESKSAAATDAATDAAWDAAWDADMDADMDAARASVWAARASVWAARASVWAVRASARDAARAAAWAARDAARDAARAAAWAAARAEQSKVLTEYVLDAMGQ